MIVCDLILPCKIVQLPCNCFNFDIPTYHSMATVKFYFRSKKDNAPITLRLLHKNEFDFFVNTQLRISKDQWSSKKGLPKTGDEKARIVKSTLTSLESSILDAFDIDYNKGEQISKDWLSYKIDVFFNRDIDSHSISKGLVDNIDRVIKTASTRRNSKGGVGLSKSRINSYKNLRRILELYQSSRRKTLVIKDVNFAFVSDFIEFMQGLKYNDGNTQKKISDIKTVCLDAQINGIETHPQLLKVTGHKIKNDYIIYLTVDELKRIQELKLEKTSLNNAKKWLLLGAMIGQRGGDLLSLSEKNVMIRNGLKLIQLVQQKGNKQVNVPFSDEMEELLIDGFPYKISIQKFNKYLKVVCELAEINQVVDGAVYDNEIKRKAIGKFEKWKLISSHDLRRTFASNNYGEMPTPLIMSITGHATESTFLKYIGKTSMDYAQQIAEFYHKRSEKAKKEFTPVVLKNKKSL